MNGSRTEPAGEPAWLLPPPPTASAQALTLLCVPHAGAGPSIYRPFARPLAPQVALRPVHLPGRESRIGERAFENVSDVVKALVPRLVPQLRGRFAVWGHSMGGFVAFELARVLEARFGMRAEALVVSGCQAPRSPGRELLPQRRELSDDALWASAVELNGIPEGVMQSPELKALLLPTLRADFAVFETYAYREGRRLSCPVHVFAGEEDVEAPAADLWKWEEETRAAFRLTEMPGGHFFHLDDVAGFSDLLADALYGERVGR
ncbi:thioesterase II family protein [Streptomyces cavernicola]|uniref:Alpha/beta fold hydrolase n=1 Tax=Streptomyces cavernicola TaxID=3043613 RepID=A0ABT6S7S1_9ACTN|nr:alpha/beta fold hydrolase [Streptomyces sp. B-S-A6]MDI3404150.1 alpha/beta fold hydrolase [Streptomyces sp. B-S-A6]